LYILYKTVTYLCQSMVTPTFEVLRNNKCVMLLLFDIVFCDITV